MQEEHAKKQLQKIYKYQNNYIKNNYDRVSVTLPAGAKKEIAAAGYSVNGLLNQLYNEWIEKNK